MEKDDSAWFTAKTFGYGVGLPIAWQGWLILGLYVAIVTGAAFWLADRSVMTFLLILIGATGPFLLIASRKTRGGLRWRWGNED
jgi:hypothetical protein